MKVNTVQPIIGADGEPAMVNDRVVATVQWAIQLVMNTAVESLPWTPDATVRCAEISRAAFKTDDDGCVEYSDSDRRYILERSAAVCLSGRIAPIVQMFLVEQFDASAKAPIDA